MSSLCSKLGDVSYGHSSTVGDYALIVELHNDDQTQMEVYRFLPREGRLHHWFGEDDVYHQGTDTAFQEVYHCLEKAGFFRQTDNNGSIRRAKEAIVGYACRLRDAERRAAAVPSIDYTIRFPSSAASERARRQEAIADCRRALGLPR